MDRVARFWMKVSAEPGAAGCWLWTGARTSPPRGQPYGRIKVSGHWIMATRYVWELERGPVPPGMKVCHHCDVPLCVRPNHLFLGTQAENMRDAKRKGRMSGPSGERNGGAKVSDAQVQEMRRLWWLGGVSQRELSERFGLSIVQVGKIVRGEVRRTS